jgi:hypothetical protein
VVEGTSVTSIATGLRRALDDSAPPPEDLPTWADSAALLTAALGLSS